MHQSYSTLNDERYEELESWRVKSNREKIVSTGSGSGDSGKGGRRDPLVRFEVLYETVGSGRDGGGEQLVYPRVSADRN